MSASPMVYHPLIQEPLEAGWLTPRQAWDLELDSLLNHSDLLPAHLWAPWQRIQLWQELLPMQ